MNSLSTRIVALSLVLGSLAFLPAPANAFNFGFKQKDEGAILQPGLRHPKAPAATLTRFDNNKTINLKVGQKVAIDLAVPLGSDRYDPAEMWSGLDLSSDQFLRPEDTFAMFIVKPGVTGQTFEAIHPGTTTITAHRNVPGTSTAQDWTVTVNAVA